MFIATADDQLPECQKHSIAGPVAQLAAGVTIGPLQRYQWDGLPWLRALPIQTAERAEDIWQIWPGLAWPFRLWQVAAEVDFDQQAETILVRRAVGSWRAFGPNGRSVVKLLERSGRLKESQATAMIAQAQKLGIVAPAWEGGLLFGRSQWGYSWPERIRGAVEQWQDRRRTQATRQLIMQPYLMQLDTARVSWVRSTVHQLLNYCPAARSQPQAWLLNEIVFGAIIALLAGDESPYLQVVIDVGVV